MRESCQVKFIIPFQWLPLTWIAYQSVVKLPRRGRSGRARFAFERPVSYLEIS
jgi:hypothetical protein